MNRHGPDYRATPLRCRACEERDGEIASFARKPNAQMHGIYFTLEERR